MDGQGLPISRRCIERVTRQNPATSEIIGGCAACWGDGGFGWTAADLENSALAADVARFSKCEFRTHSISEHVSTARPRSRHSSAACGRDARMRPEMAPLGRRLPHFDQLRIGLDQSCARFGLSWANFRPASADLAKLGLGVGRDSASFGIGSTKLKRIEIRSAKVVPRLIRFKLPPAGAPKGAQRIAMLAAATLRCRRPWSGGRRQRERSYPDDAEQ